MLVEISHVNSSPTFDRICEKALRAQSAAAYRRGDSWPREVRRCLIYRELHSLHARKTTCTLAGRASPQLTATAKAGAVAAFILLCRQIKMDLLSL